MQACESEARCWADSCFPAYKCETLHQSSHTSRLFGCPTHVVAATIPHILCLVLWQQRTTGSVSVSVLSRFQLKEYFNIQTHGLKSLLLLCHSLFSNITLRWQLGDFKLNSAHSFLWKEGLHIYVFTSRSHGSGSWWTFIGVSENLMWVIPTRGGTMVVGDTQTNSTCPLLSFQLHIYDILFLLLSVETHVSPCALVPSSVFGCSAGQPATWRFSEEPIFTLLMLLHLSFCFTGWQFGSGVNERFSTHLYYAFISQPSFNGRHGHLTVLVTF